MTNVDKKEFGMWKRRVMDLEKRMEECELIIMNKKPKTDELVVDDDDLVIPNEDNTTVGDIKAVEDIKVYRGSETYSKCPVCSGMVLISEDKTSKRVYCTNGECGWEEVTELVV